MPRLSEEMRDALMRAAEEDGEDPAEVIAAAERIIGGAEPPERAPGEPDADPDDDDEPARGEEGQELRMAEVKLFQYHLPFVKVKELRKIFLGLEDEIADDDLPCGQWLAKHGGALSGVKSSASPTSAGEEE